MGDNSGSNLGFFLVGLGVGAVLGLLFAPKPGKETRRYIGQKADEGKENLTKKSREARRQAEDLVERGKDWAAKGKDRLADALESGKDAHRGKYAG
jgi:gas vesicle protein